jgi:hypothetical protein
MPVHKFRYSVQKSCCRRMPKFTGRSSGVHPSPRPRQIVDGDGDDPADSGKSGTGMGIMMTPLTPSRFSGRRRRGCQWQIRPGPRRRGAAAGSSAGGLGRRQPE